MYRSRDKYTDLGERQKDFLWEFLKSKGVNGWQKEVAKNMSVAISTVNTHKSDMFIKFGVHTLTELMHKLLTEGF